jgi:UDP-N-acetylglucosamine 3-dehydrogenase
MIAAPRYRATVLGLGAMGMRHVRVLAGLRDRFEVVGAYDVRRDLVPLPRVPLLRGEAEAIAASDLVVVATPIAEHAGTVARALAAGRHVLVEKPLCPNAAQARALAAVSVRGPGRLFVGHSERFNPVVRSLSRLLRRDRALGIDLRRIGPSRACDYGVLVNLGVHDFDLAAYLGGGRVTLRSALGGREFARVLFDTSAGTIGQLCMDAAAPEKHRAIVVTTARWTYEGNLLHPRLSRTSRETGACTEVPLASDEPLVAQAIALADALDGGPPREIASAADGAASVELAERAAMHCARGAPVSPQQTHSTTAAENLSPIARP